MANDNEQSPSPVELRGGMAIVTMKEESLRAFQDWERLKPEEKAFLIDVAKNHPVFSSMMKAFVWGQGAVWVVFRFSAFVVAVAALITAWPHVVGALLK